MRSVAFLLLCLTSATGLWGSYPEDVYFFALNPAEWEYFASPQGNKLSVYRTLTIDGGEFSFNLQVNSVIEGEEFLYNFMMSLDEKGGVFLRSLSDGRSVSSFAQPLLIFPSGGEITQGKSLALAKDIVWETPDIPADAYRNPDADISCRLFLGGRSIEVLLRYQKGISGFNLGGQWFTPVTRRVFNSIK